MSEPTRIRAAWIIPVDRPPIENGVVEIVNGLITDVRSARPHESRARWNDCGDAALLPGLVNAHTHLEFSLLHQPIEPARPFSDWIRALVAYRRCELIDDERRRQGAIDQGVSEAVSSGTTLLGEIATAGWMIPTASNLKTHVVAFRELIGLRQESLAQQLTIASGWLADKDRLATITRGLSPHAPYTVAPELLVQSVALARQQDAPVAMHVAETHEELQLLADGTGPLVALLQSFGAWPDGGQPIGRQPLDILRILADAPRALVVHGNYLTDEEIDFLAARPNMSVVYCPRTHEFFGHEPHPWRQLLARGANVALGTDGRGSNPDLSLWSELVFLRERFPNVAPDKLLELGTLAGARALGCEQDRGSITVGKYADLQVVPLNAAGIRDPHDALFHLDCKPKSVFVSGRLASPT
jgi:cytosine/adenosine deaminase-related metal-dependent hydrolase